MAAGRGAVLLAVAVVIGIFVLNKADDPSSTTVSQTNTTKPSSKDKTSTTPSTSTTSSTIAGHQPKDVKVLSVNGTATSGVGARAKDVLLGAGYNALTPTDAKTKPVKVTVILFAPGYEPDARAIAALLQTPPTSVQPMPAKPGDLLKNAANVPNAHIIVIVGEDIAGKLPASTTTTTAKAATTTTAKSATTTTTAKAATTTSTTKKP
jgi:hypothetical protein